MEFWLPDEFHNLPPESQAPPAEEFGVLPREDVTVPEQAMPPEEFVLPGETGGQPDGETQKKPFSRLVKKWLYFCAAAIILTAAGHSEYVKMLYSEENNMFTDMGERTVEVSETLSEQIEETVQSGGVFPLSDEEIRISVYHVISGTGETNSLRLVDEKTESAGSFKPYELPGSLRQGEDTAYPEYVMLLDPEDEKIPENETGTVRLGRILTLEDIERVPVSSDGIRHIIVYAVPAQKEG